MEKAITRIVFAAGPETERGGPAKYVTELARELRARGIRVDIVHYRLLPNWIPGLRQLAYFFRLFFPLLRADAILAFDTWSVAMPALAASTLTRKPLLVRIGGDFLWERYVERTGHAVKLSQFYSSAVVKLSASDRIIFFGTRCLLTHAHRVAFNTAWQRDLWQHAYGFPEARAIVIENQYPDYSESHAPRSRRIVAAGRETKFKTNARLRAVIARLKTEYPELELDTEQLPHEQHVARLASCVAVVQPSVSDIAPNTVIEAAAAGTPFICTDDTGIRDRLSGYGYFIDMNDEAALEAALRNILEGKAGTSPKTPWHARSWTQIADEFLAAGND